MSAESSCGSIKPNTARVSTPGSTTTVQGPTPPCAPENGPAAKQPIRQPPWQLRRGCWICDSQARFTSYVSPMPVAPPSEARSSRISVPLITAIIVALCALLFWQTGQLREQQRSVDHSYQVKLEVEGLDRSLREAESYQRAMWIAGPRASQL